MVEFAFAFSIFVLLFIGFLGLAMVFFSWLTTASAAREGARYVISNPSATNSQIKTYICSTSAALGGGASACNSLTTANLRITTEPTCNTASECSAVRVPNGVISVKVEYLSPVPTLAVTFINGSRLVFLGPIWVNSQAVMRMDP